MADFVRFDERELDLLFNGPDGPVGKVLARAATRTTTAAKRLAPVDTGRLRASIAQEIGGDDDGLVARVGTNVEYAPYLEFGTSRMSARPFLRPALGAATGVTP